MDRLLHAVGLAALLVIAGCETAPISGGPAGSRHLLKERLLAESGFRLRAVTTAEQQQQLDALPRGRVSAVSYRGTTYYVFPAMQRNQVYVGRRAQFMAYRAALQAHRQEFDRIRRPNDPYSDYNMEVVTGPHEFTVRKFVGFGPLRPDY